MKPDSFSTVCTKNCVDELIVFLLSLSLFHNNEHVYIICDTITKEKVEQCNPTIQLQIHFYNILDEYSNYNRQQMEQLGVWEEFQMKKAEIIKIALNDGRKDTMLMDSDILVLGEINGINKNYELAVSPHYINKPHTDRFGFFNGGCMWTKNINVADDWIEFTKTSRFYDQASIEDLANKYAHQILDETFNFAWWRTCPLHNVNFNNVRNSINILNDVICYNNKPIKFLHTHFYKMQNPEKEFNMIFFMLFLKSKNYKMLMLIQRIINKSWVLKIPQQPMEGIWNHSDDSFRELAQLISNKHEDVTIKRITNSVHCWLDPNILLYDRPNNMWYINSLNQVKVSSLLLLGNGSLQQEGKELNQIGIHVKPWTFWPRKPELLEKLLFSISTLSYSERPLESIFIGNYENATQAKYRDTTIDWKSCIEEFHCTSGTQHKFTHEEYLMKLRSAKYGLCLRGFGSKCHREVECMAFGTIPIITPEVTIDSYMNPPVENIHYIKASTPEEVKQKISTISKDTWDEMSLACKEWYMQNVDSNNTMNTILTNIFYN